MGRLHWGRWRLGVAAVLAIGFVYLVALLAFFGQIGWSLVVLFGIALLMSLILLGVQIAHIWLRGRT